MEKKNMVLLTVIAVATLLVAVVGATFAYFTATVQDNRDEGDGGKGNSVIETKTLPSTLTVEKSKSGFGTFTSENVYPGHKDLIQLKITSPAENTSDTYFNIVYEGTNTFPQDVIKFQIYESTEDLGADINGDTKKAFNCEKISEDDGTGSFKLYEKCELDSSLKISSAHPVVTEGVSTKNFGDEAGASSQKTTLNGELPFVITGNSSEKVMYYYVVVEYVNNTGDSQNSEIGKKLEGKITVEPAAQNPGAIKDTDSSKLNEKA